MNHKAFKLLACLVLSLSLIAGFGATASAGANDGPRRVQITGEVIDTWCYSTEIMYALGTAHHRCAVWCAVGGIPVSIVDDAGIVYVVLKIEGDGHNASNPTVVDIQTHKVTVDGLLYDRDGVNYLIVENVLADGGIVNFSHETVPIQPQ